MVPRLPLLKFNLAPSANFWRVCEVITTDTNGKARHHAAGADWPRSANMLAIAQTLAYFKWKHSLSTEQAGSVGVSLQGSAGDAERRLAQTVSTILIESGRRPGFWFSAVFGSLPELLRRGGSKPTQAVCLNTNSWALDDISFLLEGQPMGRLELERFLEPTGLLAHDPQQSHGSRNDRRSTDATFPALVATNAVPAPQSPFPFNGTDEAGRFVAQYREQVYHRHSQVNIPRTRKFQKAAMSDLYVPQQLLSHRQQPEGSGISISVAEMIRTVRRATVLAQAGAGKSTLLQSICCELAKKRPGDGRSAASTVPQDSQSVITPIWIPLRDYAADREVRQRSLLQFIRANDQVMYHMEWPPGLLENLISNGRIFILADGLDEVSDPSLRRDVADDLLALAHLFPLTSLYVTSREGAFEFSALDENESPLFTLLCFDDEKQKLYVNNWLRLDKHLSETEREAKVDDFFATAQGLSELMSNPLTLALLCSLFSEKGFLPTNRVQAIQECTEMLLQDWDERRRLDTHFSLDELLRITRSVAYAIQTRHEYDAGIPEKAFVIEAASAMGEDTITRLGGAKAFARKLVRFYTERSGILRISGVTQNGQPRLNFVHQLFLEYFTAAYLLQSGGDFDSMLETITNRILDLEWYETARLVMELGDEVVSDFSQKFVDGYLKCIDNATKSGAKVRLIMYLVKIPRSIPITEALASQLCSVYVETAGACLIDVWGPPWSWSPDKWDCAAWILGDALIELTHALPSNRMMLGQALERAIINSVHDAEHVANACIGFIIGYGLGCTPFGGGEEEEEKFWTSIAKRIISTVRESTKKLAPRFLPAAVQAFQADDVTFRDVLQWHGIGALFISHRTLNGAGSFYYKRATNVKIATFQQAVAETVISRLVNSDRAEQDAALSDVEEIAKIVELFLLTPPPWIRGDTGICALPLDYALGDPTDRSTLQTELRGDAWFFMFVLFAGILEALAPPFFRKTVMESRHAIHETLRWSLLARFGPVPGEDLRKELERAEMSQRQMMFVQGWMCKEISLADPIAQAHFVNSRSLESDANSA